MKKSFLALLLAITLPPLTVIGAVESDVTIRVLSVDTTHTAKPEDKPRVIAETKALFALPPSLMPAHPSAVTYPGVPTADAKTVTREFSLEHKQASKQWQSLARRHPYSGESGPTWYSTGFYAAPGTVVTISSEELVGKNATVRIGCHTGNLERSPHKNWKRIPILSNNTKITEAVTQVANPLGGLIYITVPIGQETFSAKIKIENAIPSPLYQFGKTTPEEWEVMKKSDAPWGEIASDRVILSLPTKALRTIQDPHACLELWNKILDTERELANHPGDRYRPFRIVPDVQPYHGFMHSSYPIVATDNGGATGAIAVMCDPSLLTKPSNGGANWGYFHEIGHNYQNIDWVWSGTTEVSVNFFSLYCFDKVVGTRDGAHYGVSPKQTKSMMTEYFKAPDYEKWTKNPFLALCTFRQLQDEFGWDVFKKVFAEYLELKESERPKGDQAKRDMFVIKFSKAAGKNIVPFFRAWQIPVTDTAAEAVQNLPVWMPEDFLPMVAKEKVTAPEVTLLWEGKQIKVPSSPKVRNSIPFHDTTTLTENDTLLVIKKSADGKFVYTIDDQPITVTSDTTATLPNGKSLIEFLKEEKVKRPKLRFLIRAERETPGKILANGLIWPAEAGIESIAFSGVVEK